MCVRSLFLGSFPSWTRLNHLVGSFLKFQGIGCKILLGTVVTRILTLTEIVWGPVLILRLLSIEQKLVDKIGAQAHIRVKHAAR